MAWAPVCHLSCLAQVSNCCGATVKLGADQHRLSRLLSATSNSAELAEAKCDALAAEVAQHHKMLRRSRAQQENRYVSQSKQWRNIDASMQREL